MKASAQLLSKKGYLGPEMHFRVPTVSKISEELVKRMDDLPDEIEGVKIIDWTEIRINIFRKGERT